MTECIRHVSRYHPGMDALEIENPPKVMIEMVKKIEPRQYIARLTEKEIENTNSRDNTCKIEIANNQNQ
jgi:hypothetical protein